MILGVHVSGAGKIYQALDIAHGLGCNTMQIFTRSPQSWRNDAGLVFANVAACRNLPRLAFTVRVTSKVLLAGLCKTVVLAALGPIKQDRHRVCPSCI